MEKFRFNYKTLADLEADLAKLELTLPIEEDLSVLNEPIQLGDKTIPNRLSVQPMEGCDAEVDGSPGKLTYRRYERFARGGSGLIWFEAVAVSEAGRGKDTQLYINKDTVDNFKDLADHTRKAGLDANGVEPYLVLQITHAGRYGEWKNVAIHDPELDAKSGVDPDKPVITDEELISLEDDFVAAARLAAQAGFDAVDVKACHRYLFSELLGAHNRDGLYGGSYENRTRILKNIIRKIKEAKIPIEVTTRLNSWDGIALPYGWASDENGEPDLTDTKRLVKELRDLGVRMINITGATPYLTPHFSRPYDLPGRTGYESPEHQLISVTRLITLAKELKETVPDMIIIGTGYSWLRQFAPQVAAGVVKSGWATICGFGREAFAYPDFANDIFNTGEMSSKKVCISCSKCSELKGAGLISGCVVRDAKVYVPPYQELIKND